MQRDLEFIPRSLSFHAWNPLYTLLTNTFTGDSLPAQLFVCNGISYSYLRPATNLKSAHQPIARWLTHKPFEVGIMCKISFPARLPILTRKEVGSSYSPKYIRPVKAGLIFCCVLHLLLSTNPELTGFCTNGRDWKYSYLFCLKVEKMAAKEEKKNPFKNI